MQQNNFSNQFESTKQLLNQIQDKLNYIQQNRLTNLKQNLTQNFRSPLSCRNQFQSYDNQSLQLSQLQNQENLIMSAHSLNFQPQQSQQQLTNQDFNSIGSQQESVQKICIQNNIGKIRKNSNQSLLSPTTAQQQSLQQQSVQQYQLSPQQQQQSFQQQSFQPQQQSIMLGDNHVYNQIRQLKQQNRALRNLNDKLSNENIQFRQQLEHNSNMQSQQKAEVLKYFKDASNQKKNYYQQLLDEIKAEIDGYINSYNRVKSELNIYKEKNIETNKQIRSIRQKLDSHIMQPTSCILEVKSARTMREYNLLIKNGSNEAYSIKQHEIYNNKNQQYQLGSQEQNQKLSQQLEVMKQYQQLQQQQQQQQQRKVVQQQGQQQQLEKEQKNCQEKKLVQQNANTENLKKIYSKKMSKINEILQEQLQFNKQILQTVNSPYADLKQKIHGHNPNDCLGYQGLFTSYTSTNQFKNNLQSFKKKLKEPSNENQNENQPLYPNQTSRLLKNI